MSRRSLVIVDSKYVKSTAKAKARVGYIGYRSRERGEYTRGFFDEKANIGASPDRFLHELDHNKALQHSQVVKTHTMVISLRQSAYDVLKISDGDLRDVARDLMKDLGERKGMELTWIGALHEKHGHPHVHISILGVGKDSDGEQHRLYINQDDLKWMKEHSVKNVEQKAPLIEQFAQISESMQMTRSGLRLAAQTEEYQPARRRQRRRHKSRQELQRETNQMQKSQSEERSHDI